MRIPNILGVTTGSMSGIEGTILADGDFNGSLKGQAGRFYGPFFSKGEAVGRAWLKHGGYDVALEVRHFEVLAMDGVLLVTDQGLWVIALDGGESRTATPRVSV